VKTRRVERLVRIFGEWGVDAYLSLSRPNIRYLTGFAGEDSAALVGRSLAELITDFRFIEQAGEESPGFRIAVRKERAIPAFIAERCRKAGIRRLGFEENELSVLDFRRLSGALGGIKLVPVPSGIQRLRAIKDASEIANLKTAAKIACEALAGFKTSIRAGERERDLQARLEFEIRRCGGQKAAFDSIIAGNPRSSRPHAGATEARIGRGSPVLVDTGAVYRGYHSDLTRCYLTCKISRFYKSIYDIVLKAQDRGIRKLRDGAKAGEVDRACREVIEKAGYGKYFGHATGHGVGLEVHERPRIAARSGEILREGMAITVEPGIYLPGRFGIRIEDTVLVTRGGRDVLTGMACKSLSHKHCE